MPSLFSMLSLGACVVGNEAEHFYAELRPITAEFVKGAMKVVGQSLETFQKNGREPSDVMREFSEWVARSSAGRQPVFVGFNAVFDWAFVNWYFVRFGITNPFGIGGLDVKAFYMGLTGCTWGATRSSRLPAKYRGNARHEHHALADAIEQAKIFERMANDAGVRK